MSLSNGFGRRLLAVVALISLAAPLAGCADDDADATAGNTIARGLLGTADQPEGVAYRWYPDGDGDGRGDWYRFVDSAVQPTGFVANHTDCNDANPAVFEDPSNGVCNAGLAQLSICKKAPRPAKTDESKPFDEVKPTAPATASPRPGTLAPTCTSATKLHAYDSLAECANRRVQRDCDGDGVDGTYHGGTDCNDGIPIMYPGNTEARYDGYDNDCDPGTVDTGYNPPYDPTRFVSLDVDPSRSKNFRG